MMAAVRHLELLKYANFHFLHGLQWQSIFSCKISSRLVERLQKYCKFSIFNMAAVRHHDFLKCANKMLRSHTVYSHNLHVSAKFRHDRLNDCGNIANF